MKPFIFSLALLTAVALPVHASDTEALKEKASVLAEETAETASEVGGKLKDWGIKVWETGREAAGVAKQKLEETEGEAVGETLKGWGSSLLEAGKSAAEVTKEKLDQGTEYLKKEYQEQQAERERRQQEDARKQAEDTEPEGIAI